MFMRDLLRGFSLPSLKREKVSPKRQPGQWPLARPLIELAPGDVLSVEDAMAGIQVFGATGSGKTSGSLALLAKAMMQDGWGMLVLTTKLEEGDQWQGWAEACGRSADVLRIRPDGKHHFNFLEYLNRHPDPGAAVASNIGDLLMTLARYSKPKSQTSDTSEFFAESASYLVTQAIHLLREAGEELTLPNIGAVISNAPSHPLELEREDFENTYVAQLIRRAERAGSRMLERLCFYWFRDFPSMNERTRGDVISTITSVIYRFTEDPFADLIASSRGSNYIPEFVDAGRIMILDCPVIRYKQAGRLYQIAIKHLTQHAILRRPARDTTRPVVIFADEAQSFATHADYEYQAVCRAARGCTVYATQTHDNYLGAMGNEASVEALLASLVTRIFHANAGNTNNWAEKLIASDWRRMDSISLNQRERNEPPSFGLSQSNQLHPQVLAAEFTRLRTGGRRYGGQVDAIVFQPGRLFRQTGTPVLRATFLQEGVR